MEPSTKPSPNLTRFSTFAIAYNLFVILFGAWVRISGSGAGCGEHWPTCNGDIVPRAPSIKTIIEFTHRTTSGLSLLVTVALIVWVFRATQARHPARKAATGTLVFILLEAIIGAGLVIFGLVDKDSSSSRAIVIALHLINTLGLMACGIATRFFVSANRTLARPKERWLHLTGAVLLALTSASGAITALGDTLFPVRTTGESLAARLQRELTAPEHFLERLRIFHPAIAVGCAAFLVWAFLRVGDRAATNRTAHFGLGFVTTQVLLGLANVALAAPAWMQLTHLLVANLVWAAWVQLTLEEAARELASAAPRAATH